jgi:hypothetical protein
MVADSLMKLISALSVIGVETIRPEVTQTIVALGIDIGWVTVNPIYTNPLRLSEMHRYEVDLNYLTVQELIIDSRRDGV